MVIVNLTLTSGLSSNNRVLSISPLLFDVEISNFVCGRTLVLLVVAYYFGVTLFLTLTSVLFNRVRSISPIIHDIKIPNLTFGYILGAWNGAYCLRSL